MADNLEFANKEKTFTSAELIEDRINSLLARIYDYKVIRANEAEGEIMESWRRELLLIRSALQKVCGI